MNMRRDPLLLHVDAAGLEVYRPASGASAPLRLAAFGPGETGAFARWLALNASQRTCRVLVDLPSESFELVNLPRLGRRDGRLLLQRKLAQLFAAPELARAHVTPNAGGEGPGATRVMVHGLSQPGLLLPWLEAVGASGGEVRAVMPAAQLIAGLPLPREQAAPGRELRISFSRSGMRLSLVDQARLRFARVLTEWPLQAACQSSAWALEVPRTISYLRAQGHLAADDTIAVIVLASADSLAAPAGEPAAPPDGVWQFVAPDAATAPPTHPGGRHDDADTALLHRLLAALVRVPASAGWQGTRTGLLQRVGRSLRSARVISGGLALACALAAIGVWLWPRPASPHAAVAERAQTPAGSADPGADRPAALPRALADSAPAAAVTSSGRRIDGVLRRPDGRLFLWLDGVLVETRADVARHALPDWPPRAGGQWPASADALAEPASATLTAAQP